MNNKFKFKVPQKEKPKFKIKFGTELIIKEVSDNNNKPKDVETVNGDFVLFTSLPEKKEMDLFDAPADLMDTFTHEMAVNVTNRSKLTRS